MIRFFRKIRQNLLLEKKLSKYLAYAVGEIILVLIGILLALQINSSNSERIEKKTFKSNLQFVLEDLEQDKIDLLQLKEDRLRVVNKANIILSAVNADKKLSAGEVLINSEIMLWKSFDINDNGLERILSSNLYEAIAFEPVRKRIRDYQITYQRIQSLEKKLNESVEEMEREMSKSGSILQLYEYYNMVLSLEEPDENAEKEIARYVMDFDKMFTNNPPMLSLFQRGKLINKAIIGMYDELILSGDELHEIIQEYLDTT